MKKIYSFIIIGVFGSLLNLSARNVSADRARLFAKEFLNNAAPQASEVQSNSASSSQGSDSDGLVLVYCGKSASTKASSKAAPFYVFNRDGGGYAIVSGDDVTMPVVAYSDGGSFDPQNICPPMQWWLDGVEKTVADHRKKGKKASAKVIDAWAHGAKSTKAEGDIYCATPNWNQGNPYNCKCPLIGSSRPYTGCVPTAITEVMCYYGHPTKGTGTLDAYTFTYNSKSYDAGGYELTTTYDWTKLKNVTNSNVNSQTTAVKENLGQLMADVGQAVQAAYGLNGTGAQTGRIVKALGEHFGYRKDAKFLERDLYDETTWYNMIVDELKAGRPIIYSGTEDDGGHCFVFDGVRPSVFDMIHVNFGWGGSDNAWIDLGANYYGSQDAVFGFMPDDGTGPKTYDDSDIRILGGDAFCVTSGTAAYGSSFKISIYWVFNYGIDTFTGQLKLVRLDKNGEYKDDVSSATSEITISVGNGKGFSFPCNLKSPVEFGDQIALYRKRSSDTDWGPAPVDVQGGESASLPLSGHTRINAAQAYSLNDIFFLNLKNTKYAYLYSYYSKQEDYDSQGCMCTWEFYVDGTLYKTVSDITKRFIYLDKAGNWMVRCTMNGYSDNAVKEVITAKFTVTQ